VGHNENENRVRAAWRVRASLACEGLFGVPFLFMFVYLFFHY